MPRDLYQELKTALQDLKGFVESNFDLIHGAVQALAAMIPQITDVLNEMISLLGRLKTEIQNLDPGRIPGLTEVTGFSEKARAALESARSLLPDQAATIDQVLDGMNVVRDLPSLNQVKADIIRLIDEVSALLGRLRA